MTSNSDMSVTNHSDMMPFIGEYDIFSTSNDDVVTYTNRLKHVNACTCLIENDGFLSIF